MTGFLARARPHAREYRVGNVTHIDLLGDTRPKLEAQGWPYNFAMGLFLALMTVDLAGTNVSARS